MAERERQLAEATRKAREGESDHAAEMAEMRTLCAAEVAELRAELERSSLVAEESEAAHRKAMTSLEGELDECRSQMSKEQSDGRAALARLKEETAKVTSLEDQLESERAMVIALEEQESRLAHSCQQADAQASAVHERLGSDTSRDPARHLASLHVTSRHLAPPRATSRHLACPPRR